MHSARMNAGVRSSSSASHDLGGVAVIDVIIVDVIVVALIVVLVGRLEIDRVPVRIDRRRELAFAEQQREQRLGLRGLADPCQRGFPRRGVGGASIGR